MAGVRRKKDLLDQMLKDDIVKVVLKLIEENEAVTMNEVARRSGVSKGTLYNYFHNKDDLLEMVHQRVLIPLLETNRAIFESHHEPLQKLNLFIESVFCSHEKIATYFYFIWQNKTADSLFGERVEIIIRPLARLCQQGIDAGVFMKVDPYVLAEMIYGTVIGPLTSLRYRQAEQHDLQKMKQDIISIIKAITC